MVNIAVGPRDHDKAKVSAVFTTAKRALKWDVLFFHVFRFSKLHQICLNLAQMNFSPLIELSLSFKLSPLIQAMACVDQSVICGRCK